MTADGTGQPGSLTSSLLARKGQARPAMRPQTALHGDDDLGWNEMGEATDAGTLPPVLLQRKTLRAEFAADPAQALRASDKARAFTLRLDAGRHLRLQLAAAVEGVSAQTLVTRALDQFLNSNPEVEALARRVPPRFPRPDGETR